VLGLAVYLWDVSKALLLDGLVGPGQQHWYQRTWNHLACLNSASSWTHLFLSSMSSGSEAVISPSPNNTTLLITIRIMIKLIIIIHAGRPVRASSTRLGPLEFNICLVSNFSNLGNCYRGSKMMIIIIMSHIVNTAYTAAQKVAGRNKSYTTPWAPHASTTHLHTALAQCGYQAYLEHQEPHQHGYGGPRRDSGPLSFSLGGMMRSHFITQVSTE